MAADAERDRELYAQRAALAEEGQELARGDRKQLQVSYKYIYIYDTYTMIRTYDTYYLGAGEPPRNLTSGRCSVLLEQYYSTAVFPSTEKRYLRHQPSTINQTNRVVEPASHHSPSGAAILLAVGVLTWYHCTVSHKCSAVFQLLCAVPYPHVPCVLCVAG